MSLLIASIPNQRVEPRERGVALVVVMMIIIAITGISLWTARQSMLSEGIARNENDQAAAWQAAEAALRDAERDFISAFKEKVDNASCSRGRRRAKAPDPLALRRRDHGEPSRD
jgi:Tfp pilus assembly protein PilX